MKKVIAAVAVTVGMMLGAGQANAAPPTTAIYPPPPPPSEWGYTTPVCPGGDFSVEVINASPGAWVGVSVNGQDFETEADGTGFAEITVAAPNMPGSYNVSVATSDGNYGNGIFTVSKDCGSKPPAKKGGKTTSSSGLPATGSGIVGPGMGIGIAALAGGAALVAVSRKRKAAA